MESDIQKTQKCDNCYYCRNDYKNYIDQVGLIFPTKKSRISENHICHRSPPRAGWVSRGSTSHMVDYSLCVVAVPKDHWCGEWKQRE